MKEENENKFPLWHLLSPANRSKLANYQWEQYGVRIAIPNTPTEVSIQTKIEDIEEIDKFMRQKPNEVKGRHG